MANVRMGAPVSRGSQRGPKEGKFVDLCLRELLEHQHFNNRHPHDGEQVAMHRQIAVRVDTRQLFAGHIVAAHHHGAARLREKLRPAEVEPRLVEQIRIMIGPAAHPPGPDQHDVAGLQRHLLAPRGLLEIVRPDAIGIGNTSTPCNAAMSSRTPRAMIGGNLSEPHTRQCRAPNASVVVKWFQIWSLYPKWFSVSMWVPQCVYIEIASPE